ncbi:MAG: hypothetical protein QF441_05040 [Bacteriovoracaceae bacterium]|jgi:hypothetical protein|nr:hypothetical protein [Halobacteriovoraceae bacterium]MDP7319949.1 hypothetical protein [Bacteriovoracaceae bacterium]
MSSFTIDVKKIGEKVNAILNGQINEDADFSALKDAGGDVLVLNLKGVTHINSCGIRDWVEFQNKYLEYKEIIYQECPQVIIEQMNIVAGFIHPNGRIESFVAPYYDETNDEEIKILLTPEEIKDGKAPLKTNDAGEALEFDEIELQYFNFLKMKG